MSVRIEVPGAQGTAPNHGVTAGIRFADGVATVNVLGDNARKYFESVGATITEAAPVDPLADLRHGDKLLTDCTLPELRDLAATEGITVPSKASKQDVLRLFLAAFMEGD